MREELREESKRMQREIMQDIIRSRNKRLAPAQVQSINWATRYKRKIERQKSKELWT